MQRHRDRIQFSILILEETSHRFCQLYSSGMNKLGISPDSRGRSYTKEETSGDEIVIAIPEAAYHKR